MAMIVALVVSLLALPAFGVRREGGLERVSFSSEPLNSLDHRPAGLIEVEAATGQREIENEDECGNELRSLEKAFTKTCQRHDPGATQRECRTAARNTIEHVAKCQWQEHLACSMMARKHLFFGPVSGLEVIRALTPDKPWLTSSLP